MSATKMYNDLLFIGTSVEYISRRTKNHQVVVMDRIGYEGLKHVYDYADINHCLFMLEEMGVLPDKAFDKFWEIHHSWFAGDLLDYSKALYFQPVKFLVHCYETGTIDWRNLPVSI